MISADEVIHFQTLGFLQCRQLFSPDEIQALSDAFDAAMERQRGGKPEPVLNQDENGYSTASQDEIPFFDTDPDAFYPLLDDARILDVFEQLMGSDYIMAAHSAVIYGGGTPWHHDTVAPEGFFSMRAALYLDPLGPEDGCLTVIPGSHFKEFRDALVNTVGNFQHSNQLGLNASELPGQYPLVNEPGDVIFMNHKLYHASLKPRPGRRILRVTCVQNTTPEKNREHYDWLVQYLNGITEGHGIIYSDGLLANGGPRCQELMARGMKIGFGTGNLIPSP